VKGDASQHPNLDPSLRAEIRRIQERDPARGLQIFEQNPDVAVLENLPGKTGERHGAAVGDPEPSLQIRNHDGGAETVQDVPKEFLHLFLFGDVPAQFPVGRFQLRPDLLEPGFHLPVGGAQFPGGVVELLESLLQKPDFAHILTRVRGIAA